MRKGFIFTPFVCVVAVATLGASAVSARNNETEIIASGQDAPQIIGPGQDTKKKKGNEIIGGGMDSAEKAHAPAPGSPMPASLPASLLATPVAAGPQSIPSNLEDCSIPFEELATRAPSCTSGTVPAGQRCEMYSHTQFTEVVKVSTSADLCTGTLISSQWVLTAAHCVIGETPAAKFPRNADGDVVMSGTGLNNMVVTAANADSLPGAQQVRTVTQAIVSGRYGGSDKAANGGVFNAEDIAVLKLESPYPAEYVEPARLAGPGDFLPASTIAGYGVSNVDNTIKAGKFGATWPPLLQNNGRQLTFVPGQDGDTVHSGFCQGDSGGPVLTGRNRGCLPTNSPPEKRPRLVQGIISYDISGVSDAPGISRPGNVFSPYASACFSASLMAMQDVTDKTRHDWICRRTGGQAGGC